MTTKQNDIFSVWNRDYSKHTRLEAQKHIETIFGSTATPYEISEVLEKAYDARDKKRMFVEVNRDCLTTGETFAEFSDTEYYSQQLMNIYDLPEDEAMETAELMSNIKVNEDYGTARTV